MPTVLVVGGGLAGLSAAAALGASGKYQVRVLESRPFLGGRATSYPAPGGDSDTVIDNCQHILLKCCVNLRDFYKRLGVDHQIQFHKKFYFIEPGGLTSTLAAGSLPAPLHFTTSFLKMKCFSWSDKISLGRGLLALRSEYKTRQGLDRISMLDWLKEKRQTPNAIERFWRQILVSALNEELDRMAALHAFQVFWLGFLTVPDAYEMGIPRVPLGELYDLDVWRRFPSVEILPRHSIERLLCENGRISGVVANGTTLTADYYVCSVPFDRASTLLPADTGIEFGAFSHSPITGIHLWFDRSITLLPHATLLDRTIQWMYNRDHGKYVQLVVSASRSLTAMPRAEVIELALSELSEFFPLVSEAKVLRAHVVKEIHATFSATMGLEEKRPPSRTGYENLFLAGDWTRSGWPSTMEGAVRSGYLAAEAVSNAAGEQVQFLLPDIA